MKKTCIFVLVTALLLAVLSGCSTTAPGNEENAESGDSNKKVWATILQTNTNWNIALSANAQVICDENGWEQITLNAEGDIQKQIDLMQSCISQRVLGMFVHSLDDHALTEYVEKAIDAGIYVFFGSTGVLDYIDEKYVDSGYLYAYNYDHVVAAELAAKAVADSIGGKGKVAVLAGTAGALNTEQRNSGFVDYIAANYPDIEIVTTINCDWDQMKAMSATEDILAANPDLNAIYAMGEDMIVGAYEAASSAGRDDVQIVGIDASKKIVQMVLDGDVYAVVNCRPSGSESGCILTQLLLEGKPIDNVDGIKLDGIVYGDIPVCYTKDTASLDNVDY